MARWAPSKEVLKWYEDTLRNDPKLSHVLDNWEHLPIPPRPTDPDHYSPFISREEWGALPAKEGAEPLGKILYIRYTYVGNGCNNIEECSKFLRDFQKSCMDKGMPDIQFNFFIGAQGIIYEGRGWNWEADREEKHNNYEGLHGKLKGQSVDIAYIGDFSFYGPLNDSLNGAYNFVQRSVRTGRIDEMFEPIPFREKAKDPISPEAFFTESDFPEHIREQIKASKNAQNKEAGDQPPPS